jgi:hypothetical protein
MSYKYDTDTGSILNQDCSVTVPPSQVCRDQHEICLDVFAGSYVGRSLSPKDIFFAGISLETDVLRKLTCSFL